MLSLHQVAGPHALPCRAFTYPAYRARLVAADGADALPTIAVAASVNGVPVGLIYAHRGLPASPARILSLFVDGPHRRRGIGAALLVRLQEIMQAAGEPLLTIEYPQLRHGEALAGALARAGWPASSVYSRHFRMSMSALAECGWIDRVGTPPRFALVPWDALQPGQIEAVDARDEPGFIPHHAPGQRGASIARACSVAALDGEHIAGWSILDWQGENTLCFRSLYVRAAWRRFALGPALAAQTASQVLATPRATACLIEVADGNVTMRKVVRRMIAPTHPVVTPYMVAELGLPPCANQSGV